MSAQFELRLDEQQRLILCRPGQEDVKDVRVRRSFPWSHPDRFVSLRSSDGKELMLIEDLSQIDDSSRVVIEKWLASHSFVPKIMRIDDVDLRFGYQQWKV